MLTYNTNSNTGPVCGGSVWIWIVRENWKIFFTNSS